MDTQTHPSADIQPIIAWQAPARPHHDRSPRWYAVAGSIVIVSAAYGILVGSWPLAIVAVLCGAMYMLMRGHTPPLLTIAIYETGVLYESEFFTWSELASFWIFSTPAYHELHIGKKAPRAAQIVIQTGELSPPQLRTVLCEHLTEALEKRESILDMISRICKL